MNSTDIVICGGGLAGLVTALAVAEATSLDMALIDAKPLDGRADPRASFLAASSLRLLERLGIDFDAQPVTDILAAEGHPGEPVQPGSLHFAGDLGAVVANTALHAALVTALRATRIDVVEGAQIHDFATDIGGARLHTDQGDWSARLVIAADGRESPLRRLSEISTERSDYGQRALTFTVAHSRPHNGVAYQIFFPGGPLALLPLTGNRSSVVWTDTSAAIHAAEALPREALIAELTSRIGGGLGDLSLEDQPTSYPLVQILADRLVVDRLALVGDAAHVIHPLAGQGVNLAFRDAAALADTVAEAAALGRDIGGASLKDYARWRAGDVRGMALATDALGHAYALPGPLARARRTVTGLIDRSPLSVFLSREAAGERPNLPALMR